LTVTNAFKNLLTLLSRLSHRSRWRVSDPSQREIRSDLWPIQSLQRDADTTRGHAKNDCAFVRTGRSVQEIVARWGSQSNRGL